MPRACVIGATGFIGKRAVAVLAKSGFEVRATHRAGSSLPAELTTPGVELVACDVTDLASLVAAVAECEVVVNCAGIYRWWMPDPAVYTRINVDGARNVAIACNEHVCVRHLVHISTAMAYGYPAEKPFNESSKPGPHAAEYPRTKFLGDEAVVDVHAQASCRLTILYLACVTGPGDTFAVGRPSAVYRDFMLGKIPLLVAPDTKYIYVHIRDVEQAISTVCSGKEAGEPRPVQRYLIGNSEDMLTTRQYFELMSKFCDRPCPSLSLNLSVGMLLGRLLTLVSTWITGREPLMPLDIMRTAAWGGIEYDCGRSRAELRLEYTPIEIAVGEAMRDVKEQLGMELEPSAKESGKKSC